MSITALLLTHLVARERQKAPFFFSRFYFDTMKERGNTHFCFCCGGGYGFKPGPDGKPVDCASPSGHDPMKRHAESHTPAVIGNADKYDDVWEWLEKEVPEDFPFLVSIPSID